MYLLCNAQERVSRKANESEKAKGSVGWPICDVLFGRPNSKRQIPIICSARLTELRLCSVHAADVRFEQDGKVSVRNE